MTAGFPAHTKTPAAAAAAAAYHSRHAPARSRHAAARSSSFF